MSLPRTFANQSDYFKGAVEFFNTYSWVYREANTSCIQTLDNMSHDFKDYFLGLSNDKLNIFPYVHDQLDDCPDELLRFRQQLAKLTPSQTATAAPASSSTASVPLPICVPQRKVSLKKQHEIEQLAANIHKHCANETQLLIDLGAGLGYLSEALLRLKPNYLILGLEADEQRVQTAQKRSQELLPQHTFKSISYKQLFITAEANCRASIERYASELAQSNGLAAGLNTTIIGLHACADLSISAMLLFLTMPQVRCLHIMPCCYHKLAVCNNAASARFVNFPLSSALQQAVSAEVASVCFQRPFMRLACQQTSSHWSSDAQTHADHGQQMYLRALASALASEDELVKVRRCKDKLLKQVPATFSTVQQRYELHSQQTQLPVNWTSIHEARFKEISERYSEGRGHRLAEALCCLQASMQQLCENVVLYDRLCYLKELAAAQQQRLEVCYEKLFDEKVSPRCHVLIARKL